MKWINLDMEVHLSDNGEGGGLEIEKVFAVNCETRKQTDFSLFSVNQEKNHG